MAPENASSHSLASEESEKPPLHHDPTTNASIYQSPPVDEEELVYLPYRTLSNNADMTPYRVETAAGQVMRQVMSHKSGNMERYEVVTFTIGDKENPKNWSKAYKWYCTMSVAITCFVVAFNSAVITADIGGVAEEFNCSEEAALVSITVFVVGFGLGPMLFAPFSENFGRRPIYASTLLLAVIFIIPCAVANNLATLLVCRAIDGIAFSAPMVLVGGTLADLWRNEERGKIMPWVYLSAMQLLI